MLEGIRRETGFEKGPCNCEVLDSTLPNYFATLGKPFTPSGPVPTFKVQMIITVQPHCFVKVDGQELDRFIPTKK